MGHIVNLIGDSSSGKSMFALSTCAETYHHKDFKDYRFIYDDVENANTFNMPYLFGEDFSKALEAPDYEDVDGDLIPLPSRTIEDFHCNVCDALEGERPFIYVLDSFDALDSDQDIEKIESMRIARKKGNKATGSYGMSKAKKASELLRHICGAVKKTKSLVIVISQTRDDIDPMSFSKKKRSGGKALKFYAHHEIWLSMGGKLKSKDQEIGNLVKAKITKNKITGKSRVIQFPIYYDYGVDDIRSCLTWIDKEKFWVRKKNTVFADELKIKGTIRNLVPLVEKKNLEEKLRRVTGKYWMKKEQTLRLKRKPRYE